MKRLSVSRVPRLARNLVALLLIIFAVGQGCGRLDLSRRGGTSRDLSGNGGGYGGMQSVSDGTYGGGGVISSGDSLPPPSGFFAPYYFLVGAAPSCASYPTPWQSTGGLIAGVIVFDLNHNPFYQPGVCSSPAASAPTPVAPGDLSIADFDTDIAIYQGRIYQHFAGNPPPLSELVMAEAYCRSGLTFSANGAQLGRDVLVYSRGSEFFAEISLGQEVNDTPTRFYINPFAVKKSVSGSFTTFSAPNFNLSFAQNTAVSMSGQMTTVIDGSTENVAVQCWIGP